MYRIKKAIVISMLLCSFTQVTWAAEEQFDINLASGTPVVEALRAISLRADKDIVINGELTGTVSLNLDNTTFSQALACLAAVNGFSYIINDNVALVSPADKMSQLETFKVNYLDLETLKKQLSLFVPAAKINVNPDTSTVTVDGTSTQLQKVREHLQKNDIAQEQINVQATVVEISQSKAREMGLDFTLDEYKKGSHGISWAITAKHEETKSLGNVLANPAVTVFNGKKASILIGDKVPVFTTSSDNTGTNADTSVTVEYKDVGVKLEVTPRVNDVTTGMVSLKIAPSISTISEWKYSGNNMAPQISTREASTELRVKDGETIYLGGLLKDQETKSIKAIPFLSKLPILGELFKSRSTSKQKTEIIIAITPHIVKEVGGVPQIYSGPRQGVLTTKLKEEETRKEALEKDILSQPVPQQKDKKLVQPKAAETKEPGQKKKSQLRRVQQDKPVSSRNRQK
jgi:type IV pilus assembly protein PilQ